MRARAVPGCLVFLFLAGCLGAEDPVQEDAAPPTVESLAARVDMLIGALACEATVDDGDSANVKEVAASALDEYGYGSPAELWIQGERAFVARYATGGFNIVDISDPLAPAELGYWDPDTTDRGLDVKATPDGTGVLMGGDAGVRLVDIRDPAEPVLERELALETQAHMLTVFQVADLTYVGVSKGDGEDFPIYRLDGEPGDRTFVKVSSPRVAFFSGLTGTFAPHDLLRTHDASFFYDPLLDAPTIWIADSWSGLAALDVSDPASPKVIADIPNLRPQYTHTVQTVVLDERRITVSVAEVGANTMKVYDTTDLTAPKLLAEWSVPNTAQPQHNLQVVPPYVYVAHYAEGVFVFSLDDLLAGRTAPVARLASAGHEPQSADPLVTALGTTGLLSGAWDVGLRDGLMYVTDGALRVAAFGCLTPGDAVMSSVS